MKRSFVEPQMKVMAVNMKENIACSICNDDKCTDKTSTATVKIGKNNGLSVPTTVHVKTYNKQIFNTSAYNDGSKFYNIDSSCNV